MCLTPQNDKQHKDFTKMPRRKEPGSLTGSKRVKQEKAATAGSRAKKMAESAGTALKDAAKSTISSTGQSAINIAATAVSSTANATTTAVSNAKQAVTDGIQARNALVGEKGYSGKLSQTTTNSDPYGGLSLPELNLSSLIPTDLLNPSGLPECSHEQLNQGLSQYASASRAMQLYQAGYKYIADVGKVKQQSHKAQSSIIKGVTEEIKVQHSVVENDVANIELEQKLEKRNQAEETLKQEQIKTVAAINETEQLRQKLEAQEDKREAEIQRIIAQTNQISQKYLQDSIQGIAV